VTESNAEHAGANLLPCNAAVRLQARTMERRFWVKAVPLALEAHLEKETDRDGNRVSLSERTKDAPR